METLPLPMPSAAVNSVRSPDNDMHTPPPTAANPTQLVEFGTVPNISTCITDNRGASLYNKIPTVPTVPLPSASIPGECSDSPASPLHQPNVAPHLTPAVTGKRFQFSETFDIVLISATMTSGAHVAAWGKSQTLFKKVAELFLSSGQFMSEHSPMAPHPTWKSLSDRLKKLVTDRRAADHRNRLPSGISETHGEPEILLDDLIQQIDENREADGTDKDERGAIEKLLQDAGEAIRQNSLKRKAPGSWGSSILSTGRLCKGENVDDMDVISRKVKLRWVNEEERTRIEVERLAIESRREKRDAEHFVHSRDVDKRRSGRITDGRRSQGTYRPGSGKEYAVGIS